jgi:hypothetical protein
MRLFVDTSRVTFQVSVPAVEKADQDGRQKADRRTGEPLWTVEVVAFEEKGAEVLKVTVAGSQPKLAPGTLVSLVELEAIPWVQDKRNGVAFRAKSIQPVTAAASKAA